MLHYIKKGQEIKKYFNYITLYKSSKIMNYLTHQLLNPEEIKVLSKALNNQNLIWEDGKKTAGSCCKRKENLQLNRNSEISLKFSKLISKKSSLNL